MLLSKVVAFLVGLFVTVILECFVGPLLKRAGDKIKLIPPSPTSEEQWRQLTSGNEGGKYIGRLERLIFFAAFFAQAYAIIGGWLVFKVASKWEAWSNVVSVPSRIEGIKDLDFLVARRRWASHVLVTFQVGTAYNIVAGLVGA
ncbi:MAG: hypothetical protein P8Y67_09695, partial [Alphaproteobacteria bacterium]